MSRCHCSGVILCAGAIVVVIAAFETQTSIVRKLRNRVGRQVDGEIGAVGAVERNHAHPVRAQTLGDRGADPAGGAGHQGGPAESSSDG